MKNYVFKQSAIPFCLLLALAGILAVGSQNQDSNPTVQHLARPVSYLTLTKRNPARQSLQTVNAAFVEGYDRKVSLEAIANFEVRYEPTLLTRYQRERSIWIQARPETGIQAREVIATLEPRVRDLEKEMPPGYHIQNGGIDEEAVRGERANSVALGVGMALVIICLVLQYNSAVKPLLILLTVPLSIIGGLLGLWLRGIPFGFIETLGFLALFGTVLNAAILIEKINCRGSALRLLELTEPTPRGENFAGYIIGVSFSPEKLVFDNKSRFGYQDGYGGRLIGVSICWAALSRRLVGS